LTVSIIICCLNRLKELVILYITMSSQEAVIIDDVIYTVGDYFHFINNINNKGNCWEIIDIFQGKNSKLMRCIVTVKYNDNRIKKTVNVNSCIKYPHMKIQKKLVPYL